MASRAQRGGRKRSTADTVDRLRRIDEYYREVADGLVAQIEKGTAPWTQAWQPGEKALPANLRTGKAYRGGNSVWLLAVAERRGYSDERWGTYRQVRDLDGQVRKGEKGTRILYWHFEDRRIVRDRLDGTPILDEKGKPVYESRTLALAAGVHLQRVQRGAVRWPAQARGGGPRPAAWDGHREADLVLERSGARIEHSGEDRAYYDLRRDRIVLPYKEQFPERAGYYQSALHELGHWTGHASRLNRATLQEGIVEGPDSKQYAREELRAEISSMMTGDRLNLGHDPARSAAYVGHWIQALRDDSREIYRAARDGQDISDYLLEPARDRAAEREAEERGAAPAKELEPVVRSEPVPELPAPATQPLGGAHPGDQFRLFQGRREEDRSGPSR